MMTFFKPTRSSYAAIALGILMGCLISLSDTLGDTTPESLPAPAPFQPDLTSAEILEDGDGVLHLEQQHLIWIQKTWIQKTWVQKTWIQKKPATSSKGTE